MTAPRSVPVPRREGAERTERRRTDEVWDVLRGIDDPEYPGISIVELGLVEAVRLDGGSVEVDLLPTFSGCPALPFIAEDIRAGVGELDGIDDVVVTFLTNPAWTPARISPAARRRIGRTFGVAVKVGAARPPCPYCGADELREQSLFGPVRCRSVHRCAACGEVVETIR
jgi:ring-1,2-phenylacetyl-CoA epoxidase subunit PaaD